MLSTIQPSAIKGKIQAPASKSSMQRACAAALLRTGETTVEHPGHSNDDKAALGVIQDLGAGVKTMEDGSLRIRSRGMGISGDEGTRGRDDVQALEVNCGESGLGIRMFAPIIALSSRAITVRGEGSLLSRPMDFFDEIFPQLGIRVVSNKGKLPLEIQGPLQPRSIGIDGSLSSQFLTGLLMAYAAAGAKDVAIKVNNLKSKPYIDLTLQVMKHFGWEVENRDYKEFYFSGRDAGAKESEIRYTVEGDWSGGAFLLVAGALAGPITVCGLDISSTQADKAILRALQDSGAAMRVNEGGIEIGPGGSRVGMSAGSSEGTNAGSRVGMNAGSPEGMNAGSPEGMNAGSPVGMHTGAAVGLRAFSFDATDCPDLFPPLVALAAYCAGTTVIEGVSRLAHKESDRALTLQEEFGKMGVSIVLAGDRMLIRGGEGLKGAVVHSRHDHRIAMACAVAALGAGGAVTIEEAQAINKSYPDFYEHLQQLGVPVGIREANTGDMHTKH